MSTSMRVFFAVLSLLFVLLIVALELGDVDAAGLKILLGILALGSLVAATDGIDTKKNGA